MSAKRPRESDRRGASTKSSLRRLDVKPRKSRGQNFLLDQSVLKAIVAFGQPTDHDAIVEIGPGLGALTEYLAHYPNLHLIELESKFCEELRRKYPRAKIINSDVRGVDFATLGKDLVVFGNLPYVYSSEILFHLINYRSVISRAVLLLQDEFAQRMAAGPGTRDFGVLSVNLQMWCGVKLGEKVPGDSFHPATKVTSRIVRVDFLDESRFPIPPHERFRKVVQAAFAQRRKKLVNSLSSSGYFNREQIENALKECAIDGGRRAETLSLQEFSALATILCR